MTRSISPPDVEALVARLVAEPGYLDTLDHPLPDHVAGPLVLALKAEADRHWTIDARGSLRIADMIITIGERRDDRGQLALGTMARGDALRHLGEITAAWETLDEAGRIYREGGDEIGWARTRIGRLYLSPEVERVDEALADAAEAEAIFTRAGDLDKLLRLAINLGTTFNFQGDHRGALEQFARATALIDQLGEPAEMFRGIVEMATGYSYQYMGKGHAARANYERAADSFRSRDQHGAVPIVELNLASLELERGRYRDALAMLHRVAGSLDGSHLTDWIVCQSEIVNSYLVLGRPDEARDRIREVLPTVREKGSAYREAEFMLYLGRAETALGRPERAIEALDHATSLYLGAGAEAWTAMSQLYRGRVELEMGDSATALACGREAERIFVEHQRPGDRAAARLLVAAALFSQGELDLARGEVREVLASADGFRDPAVRYESHFLLGRIAESEARWNRARKRYRAAAATVERLLRGLTITIRSGFLADKGEALRRLIALDLAEGHVARALTTLEQSKSQLWLAHILDQQLLRWREDDEHSRALVEELEQLRESYHLHYRLATRLPGEEVPTINVSNSLVALGEIERQMRDLTEQLYLESAGMGDVLPGAPTLEEIVTGLSPRSLLVEYYRDGDTLWAFQLDRQQTRAHRLPISGSELDRLQERLAANVRRALRAGPLSPAGPGLARLFERDALALYRGLFAPLQVNEEHTDRVVIVPYGALHYLPFHLLYDGERYLSDYLELVQLPAAGLVTHRGVSRTGKARILIHSHGGMLPHTRIEGETIQRLLGGELFYEEDAHRDRLSPEPVKVLHVAAHGEFRIDRPEFSTIILGDGALFADDLLQHDLSYELVTLSACDTGRARVAPGDELIGLGRAILYAGAGALIASLWRVSDKHTSVLMHHLYGALLTGHSKPAALRHAQQTVRVSEPELHPAFWGAFMLIGDPSPMAF